METDLVDVRIMPNGGSLIQLQLLSVSARSWVDENVDAEPYMFLGEKLCVEPRYVQDIIDGMIRAGLTVEA